jgi:hypothetical protein
MGEPRGIGALSVYARLIKGLLGVKDSFWQTLETMKESADASHRN